MVRKSRQMEVSTEMVQKPDMGDELSRLYDELLAEEPELDYGVKKVEISGWDAEPIEEEHPRLMTLVCC